MIRTLLYAEDEENDALFLELALEKVAPGVALRVVDDGRLAVAYLAGEPPYANRARFPLPDVVLLDVNLPMRSGLDVLHWIRRQPGLAKTPVVMFSSSGREADRRAADLIGADLYLVKPASGDQFDAIVAEVARRWFPERLRGR